jgi:hypothetical protein
MKHLKSGRPGDTAALAEMVARITQQQHDHDSDHAVQDMHSGFKLEIEP